MTRSEVVQEMLAHRSRILGARIWRWAECIRRGYVRTVAKEMLADAEAVWEGVDGERDHLLRWAKALDPKAGEPTVGEKPGPRGKLTIEQVQEMRALWAEGETSQSELAHRFGVTQSNVSAIVTGKTWQEAS